MIKEAGMVFNYLFKHRGVDFSGYSYPMIERQLNQRLDKTELQDLPDLIFLDIFLPGMDGFAVAKEIKADEKANHIPVIALTAHAMKGDRDKVIAAGCNDYLSKPIDPGKIVETIERWLGETLNGT